MELLLRIFVIVILISTWINYKNGCRKYCGHNLRDGYKKNDKLDNIILTPTTKSEIK